MSNWPKHKNPTSDDRKATAPYNFVPLPDSVETVAPDDIPGHDTYQPDHYTGHIEVKLTSDSPLYVRCGWSPEDFDEYGKESFHKLPDDMKQKVAQFFHTRTANEPVIPGSSLRGMLRSMVEIVSYGKIQPVSEQKLFYRAVAERSKPWRNFYHEMMGQAKAGYVQISRQGILIIPAIDLGIGETFFKVKERIVKAAELPNFVPLRSGRYKPTQIPCSFQLDKYQDKKTKQPGFKVTKVGLSNVLPYEGVLVCSGYMNGKRNHWIVNRLGDRSKAVVIEDQLIEDYREAMTDFEKEYFDNKYGCLQDGKAIFYIEQNNSVVTFGHTRNFRMPYWDSQKRSAITPKRLTPDRLHASDKIDFAEALFGYVGLTVKQESRAGRVFIVAAKLLPEQENVFQSDDVITPEILSGPKPTTFQHYLTQQNPDNKNLLDHYGSPPPDQTVIRGHKFYWNKNIDWTNSQTARDFIEDKDFLNKPQYERDKDKQHTQIRPIKPGVSFAFTIHFENLSEIELGALLWVLNKGADENYRLKLGMGKPLGMGAVKTEPTLYLTDRQNRYQRLFDGEGWQLGLRGDCDTVAEAASKAFEAFVKDNHADAFGGEGRINQLLALLSWPGPDPKDTEYMKLEEFKKRKVLPTPLYVLKDEPSKSDGDFRNGPTTSQPRKSSSRPSPEQTKKPPLEDQLPKPGEEFTGDIFEIYPTGVILIEIRNIPKEKAQARIRPDQVGNKQYQVGFPARCEVIEVKQLGDIWYVDCKPAAKKKRGRK